MKYSERDELVESLREFADYLENDRRAMELDCPYMIDVSQYIHVYGKDADGNKDYTKVDEFETRMEMRKLAKALAPCKKDYSSSSFELRRNFGTKLKVRISTSRAAVCERKVIGTKTIPEKTYTEPERVEEEVEWICSDSLLAS